MTTQVNFKIDKKLKDQAMKKAQAEGVPFTSILTLATKAYVEGHLALSLVEPLPFNEKTRAEIAQALKDIEAGKGLSPRFKNASDAIAYLRKR